MQLARNKHQRSMAKILAVLALLCTAALQLQEVGHEHWLDLHDSYAECLLCKGSGAAAVNDPEASAALPAPARLSVSRPVESPRASRCPAFLARGPPVIA